MHHFVGSEAREQGRIRMNKWNHKRKNLKPKQVLSAWSAWLHDPQASLLVLNDHSLTRHCCLRPHHHMLPNTGEPAEVFPHSSGRSSVRNGVNDTEVRGKVWLNLKWWGRIRPSVWRVSLIKTYRTYSLPIINSLNLYNSFMRKVLLLFLIFEMRRQRWSLCKFTSELGFELRQQESASSLPCSLSVKLSPSTGKQLAWPDMCCMQHCAKRSVDVISHDLQNNPRK